MDDGNLLTGLLTPSTLTVRFLSTPQCSERVFLRIVFQPLTTSGRTYNVKNRSDRLQPTSGRVYRLKQPLKTEEVVTFRNWIVPSDNVRYLQGLQPRSQNVRNHKKEFSYYPFFGVHFLHQTKILVCRLFNSIYWLYRNPRLLDNYFRNSKGSQRKSLSYYSRYINITLLVCSVPDTVRSSIIFHV